MERSMSDDQPTLFGRPIDRRELLKLTGKVLAGGTLAGMWLSPELAGYVEAAATGRASGGSVTVMNQYSPLVAQWTTYLKAFTKETGITIHLDDQNYNNQYQKIFVMGTSGTPADDVVAIDTIWTGSFGAAGFTLDMTNFLPAAIKAKIAAPALASVGYKGKLYGAPAYNSSKHFYYNEKMLKSVGLMGPPTTMDQLLHYCEVLKANKAKLGIQYPMSWSWIQKEALTCDFVQMCDSLGGRAFATDNLTPVFNKGAGVQALTMMKMMLDKGYAAPGSITHTETDVENDLITGHIAMCTNWEGTMTVSLDPKQASPKVRGNIRIALIPGSANQKSGSVLGPEGWAIMKASPRQAQAKAFVNWFITVQAQQQGMVDFGQFPIYPSMYSDPTLRKLVAAADGQDDFANYGAQFNYAQARPNFPGYTSASQLLQVRIHKAFLGQQTPQQALNGAVADMKAASGSNNNP